jgi:hypothetical protein
MPHDPFNAGGSRVYELSGWRLVLARLLAGLLRAWYATYRLRIEPDTRQVIATAEPPRIIVGWHNRSFIAPAVLLRLFGRGRIRCLVSPSRNGAWQAAVFARLGIVPVRGSSTRRGIPALLRLIHELRAGNDVLVSPDGPSGPVYQVQPGVLALARASGRPMLLLNANCRHAWRLRCWDRHLLPPPFARLEVRARLLRLDDDVLCDSDCAARRLRAECLELVDEPDHLFAS